MRERQPITQMVNSTQVRSEWSKLSNQVFKDKTRLVVEKSGIPVVAIISMDDLSRYLQLEEQRKADFSILEEISAAFGDQDDETIEREVNKVIAEVRAEYPIGKKRSSRST